MVEAASLADFYRRLFRSERLREEIRNATFNGFGTFGVTTQAKKIKVEETNPFEFVLSNFEEDNPTDIIINVSTDN